MNKVLIQVIWPHANSPLCWKKTFYAENEDAAMKLIREMDKDGVGKITLWELKKVIEL